MAVFALIPILLYFYNVLYLENVDLKVKSYTNRYIVDSDTIEVAIPFTPDLDRKQKKYITSLSISKWGNNIKCYNTATFYSEKYKRYLSLVTFNGYNTYREVDQKGEEHIFDAELEREDFINSRSYNMIISAHVNRIQWNDSSYGTKENPMPIFWKRTLSDYDSEMEYVATVSDRINRNFVREYLLRFLPKKEFKRLYGINIKGYK